MLVSAVMPTRGRPEYAAMAVECFLSQTWENKELVILDDFDTPSFPKRVEHPLIRYYQTENIVFNIPVKRNRVNALAQGEIIWHLDSDDWSSPDRMAEQVARLDESGKAVTGYYRLLFHRDSDGTAYEYFGHKGYVCGTSLCYRKDFWEQQRFIENKFTGSDNHFVRAARDASQLDAVIGGPSLVARIHPGNTNHRHKLGPEFHSVDPVAIPPKFYGYVGV